MEYVLVSTDETREFYNNWIPRLYGTSTIYFDADEHAVTNYLRGNPGECARITVQPQTDGWRLQAFAHPLHNPPVNAVTIQVLRYLMEYNDG
jgi:hypothetical protein